VTFEQRTPGIKGIGHHVVAGKYHQVKNVANDGRFSTSRSSEEG
jgi:hypothetical protein